MLERIAKLNQWLLETAWGKFYEFVTSKKQAKFVTKLFSKMTFKYSVF